MQECTEDVRDQRQDLNTLIHAEVECVTQDLQALEQLTRRVYNQGMPFLNSFCTQSNKYLESLSTQRRVVTHLLDRIRPLVSEHVLEQAKQLRTTTLTQQKLWYDAQDDLDDMQTRQKRNARRGMKVLADKVT